ncbi:MAG: aldehyde dehydrogenase (NADP(+)) [Tenacibaculum sp.]
MITGKNFVGNELKALGNKTYTTFNPQKNKENPTVFTEATNDEINEAVKLATKAFIDFKNKTGNEKAHFLNTIAEEINAVNNLLITTYCNESGLSINRAKAEIKRTIFQLHSFASLIQEGSWVNASINIKKETVPKSDIRKINIPIGPIAVFGASNFPLAYSTAGGDTAAALAAGCPVIVKSHPMHAGTGEIVASAIIKAVKKTGMPNGVFSNLNSSGIEVGQQLVMHPQIKAVGFTGSIKGGRALLDLAAKRKEPIPVFAEMGSTNPVILLPKSVENKTETIVKNLSESITNDAGQFCTNPGLILGIKSNALSEFINALTASLNKKQAACMLHPTIVAAYERNKTSIINQNGVIKVSENKTHTHTNYATPIITTVQGNTFLENPTLHQEVFGPFSIVVQCDNTEQLEKIITNLEGQLTGTLVSDENEITEYSSLIAALQNRVGRIIFNGVPTGVEVCASMVHGGPYPASSDSRFTAVGTNSIKRWVRPFSYQNWPNELLPDALKNSNPLQILRYVNGKFTKEEIMS